MFVECSDQGAKLLASVRPVISQVAELARAWVVVNLIVMMPTRRRICQLRHVTDTDTAVENRCHRKSVKTDSVTCCMPVFFYLLTLENILRCRVIGCEDCWHITIMSCSKLLSTRPYYRSIFCDKPNIENSNMRLLYSLIYEHLLFFGSGTLCGFHTYVGAGADDIGLWVSCREAWVRSEPAL